MTRVTTERARELLALRTAPFVCGRGVPTGCGYCAACEARRLTLAPLLDDAHLLAADLIDARESATAAESENARLRAAILEERAAKLHDQRMAAAVRNASTYEAQAEARRHKLAALQRLRAASRAVLALAAVTP